MSYTVIILPTAQTEFDKAYDWLIEQTPQHAPIWYNGMIDAMLSLENLPTRCPIAPESRKAREEIRHLLYGDKHDAYRILFSIRDETVLILHIRHAARQDF